MIDLIKGDRIRHKVHKREGTVTCTPRAHSPAAQCRLDGNESTSYYRLVDLEQLTVRPEKPVATVTPNHGHAGTFMVEIPSGTRPTPVVVPVPVPSDLDVGQLDDVEYGGDLRLPKLVGMRNDLANRLAMLDDQILSLRIAIAVKNSLRPLTKLAAPEARAQIAAQAVKLRQDLDAATQEAK